jgi:hypothetical protein
MASTSGEILGSVLKLRYYEKFGLSELYWYIELRHPQSKKKKRKKLCKKLFMLKNCAGLGVLLCKGRVLPLPFRRCLEASPTRP